MARVRRSLLLLCLAVLALVGPLPGVAPVAAAGAGAMCMHQWTDTLTPGSTTTSRFASFSSHGESGVIRCSGTVAGQEVTGQGTFGEEGSIVGSCSSGEGKAVFSITLPTSGGPVHLRLPVTFSFVPGFGQTSSDLFPGDFLVRPVKGDCVTTPVTEIDVVRFGQLRA